MSVENTQAEQADPEGEDDEIYLDLDEVDADAQALIDEAVAAVDAGSENAEADPKATAAAAPKRKAKAKKAAEPDAAVAEPEELERLKEENADLHERVLRTLADLENLRKRSQREQDELKRNAGAELLRSFLEVIDNLDRALTATGSVEDLAQGVEMTRRQMLDLYKRHGVEAIEADGELFDPALHEAVARVEADVQAPTVMDEFQKGYTMNGRLLRPAMVRVAMPADRDTTELDLKGVTLPEESSGSIVLDAEDGEEVRGTDPEESGS